MGLAKVVVGLAGNLLVYKLFGEKITAAKDALSKSIASELSGRDKEYLERSDDLFKMLNDNGLSDQKGDIYVRGASTLLNIALGSAGNVAGSVTGRVIGVVGRGTTGKSGEQLKPSKSSDSDQKLIENSPKAWVEPGPAGTVGAKGTATAGRELTPVFKDADTGLNAINPVISNNKGRIQELGFDPDKGKLALHEGQAAIQLENSLGGTLKRVDPPTVPGQKNPDFVFVDGPYAGKTVDFMWTDDARSAQMNKFFSNNSLQNQRQLIDHVGRADVVPLDYRNLIPANQGIVNLWIKSLTAEQ